MYESSAYPLLSADNGARYLVADLVRDIKPAHPLHIFRHSLLRKIAQEFISGFPGTVMYAVKSNPHEDVIAGLTHAGISAFDVASIEEIRLVRRIAPTALIHYMHTVKSREAIREAYFTHGVRVFAIDTLAELHKILHETELANDLEIFVRIALPKNREAILDFSCKFGAPPMQALALLREARLVAYRLGIMFHVGTQSRNPEAFRRGITLAKELIEESGVTIESLDVGGGFPVGYADTDVLPLKIFWNTISDALRDCGLDNLNIYCEPGRALTAESGILIVRVEQRKDKALYLNDGVYGGMSEAAKWAGSLPFPVTHIPRHERESGYTENRFLPFRFLGPSCDSLDSMKGPFFLPADIAEGDWIAIWMSGAYSNACRSNFNGFGEHRIMMADF